jgi:hypothetical protein
MALEVLEQVRTAEEAALETRRVALASAREAVKLAEQENAAYREQRIGKAKADMAKAVAEAQQASQGRLEERQAERLAKLDALSGDEDCLKRAAKAVLERILQ